MQTNTHVDARNGMVKLDESIWVIVKGYIDRHRDHATHSSLSEGGRDHTN